MIQADRDPTIDELRDRLHAQGLRATTARVEILRQLTRATHPQSSSEIHRALRQGLTDAATVYRSLLKLVEVGLVEVVTRVGGMDRYALAHTASDSHQHTTHPHFMCRDCGQVSCLPMPLSLSFPTTGPWSEAIRNADVQLSGDCPDCAARNATRDS